MSTLDRRGFLAGSAVVGLTAACGRGGDDEEKTARFLVPAFPVGGRDQTMVAAGTPQRIPWILRDDVDVMRDAAPATVVMRVERDGTEVWSGEVPAHRDGIITPYYPLVVTFPEPGGYAVSIAGADPVAVEVIGAGAVPLVQLGESMRPVATPTVTEPLGVEPICTRAVPCPFHDVSLDRALDEGRPTVLLVATPGFCQTDICGPVVDLLVDAVDGRDDLAVVHGEVYIDPSEFETGGFPDTTPVVEAYSLPFEPQLVVADGEGTVRARLDTAWDRAELDTALQSIS